MNIENITSNNMNLTENGRFMQIEVYEKEIERLNNEIKQYKEYIKELKDSLINYHIKNNKLINKNEEKDKEIKRLNNIINELEHDFESYELEYLQDTYQGSLADFIETELERIQELKGSDKE